MVANVIQPTTTGTYTLGNGDTLVVSSGGQSSKSIIGTGGTETISGFATGVADILSGGTQLVYGTETGDVISSGAVGLSGGLLTSSTMAAGTVFVNSGARIITLAESGGTLFVSGGGQVSGIAMTGGTLNLSGGQATGATVGAGASENIYQSGFDAGGTVSGVQFINAGGQAVGDTIAAGGTQTVNSGGLAIGATVAGTQTLSGGTASAAMVGSGGSLLVAAGSASAATISGGGSATIMAGGVLSGATISSGGELTVQGATVLGSIANAGDVTFSFGTSNTFTGALSGTGTITVGGQATLVLAGTDTGTGATTIGFGGSLELANATAAGTGAITFGTGTGTLILDGAAPTNVISGVLSFGTDKIVLENLGGATPTITQTSGDLVTVTAGTVSDTLNIANSHNYSFAGTTSAGVFTLVEQAACFLHGSLIAVPGGEVLVETLRAGDLVLLEGGKTVPVRWVGRGSGPITDANRFDLAPVILRAGALADGIPRRDLRLTRRHGVRVGAVLVPVELLINDHSVVWDAAVEQVDIFHIEIDGHGMLLADGAPAESFRDDGSARLFANAADRPDPRRVVEPCLPLALSGPALDQAWAAVAARAADLPEDSMTTDPDLHIEQADRRIEAFATEGNTYRFRLPRPSGDIVLRSRSIIPASIGSHADVRRLGVALTGLEAGGVRHSPALLRHGVHDMEGGHRWTNGRAVLPAALFAGEEDEVELTVHVAGSLRYRAPLAGVSPPG